jgi:uncharacterized protein with HEPN domain
MPREFLHVVDDIVAAINGIEEATTGKSFDDFSREWVLRHAVQRGIEIISEASRSLPDHVLNTRPEIPWPRVRAIGNVLRHEYHGLSDRIIWAVVIDEIPRLRTAIESIRDRFPEGRT